MEEGVHSSDPESVGVRVVSMGMGNDGVSELEIG